MVLSVQPGSPVSGRSDGAAVFGGARRGSPDDRAPMVTLRTLRVGVATPDPQLAARITLVVTDAGHEMVLVSHSPFDAMEAAFSRSVEVLLLDQELQRLTGSEIATVVRSVGTTASVVVLHRGELASADDLLVLDPTRPGFDDALTNVLGRLANTAGAPRPR
jgi:hypothetical protein